MRKGSWQNAYSLIHSTWYGLSTLVVWCGWKYHTLLNIYAYVLPHPRPKHIEPRTVGVTYSVRPLDVRQTARKVDGGGLYCRDHTYAE